MGHLETKTEWTHNTKAATVNDPQQANKLANFFSDREGGCLNVCIAEGFVSFMSPLMGGGKEGRESQTIR